ncbi:MAG: GNAT family N-acetyltransferase [Bacillota bacterium]
MTIRTMRKQDFDYLVTVVDEWWGRPVRHLLHPVFLYQFGDTAFVAENKGAVVGFLVGFAGQRDPEEAYVHMVAVAPASRHAGVGRALYESFIEVVAERGCRRIKAITTPGNRESVAFHTRMGFVMVTEDAVYVDDVPAVRDYAGPGQHRVVFVKTFVSGLYASSSS